MSCNCNCCVPTACKWLLLVDKVPSVLDADFQHAYMLPDNSVWVLSSNREDMVQLSVSRSEFDNLKKRVDDLVKAVK